MLRFWLGGKASALDGRRRRRLARRMDQEDIRQALLRGEVVAVATDHGCYAWRLTPDGGVELWPSDERALQHEAAMMAQHLPE